MRVLIVDDEKNIRRTMTVALASVGRVVAVASNGATALAEVRAKSFDGAYAHARGSGDHSRHRPGHALSEAEETLTPAGKITGKGRTPRRFTAQ